MSTYRILPCHLIVFPNPYEAKAQIVVFTGMSPKKVYGGGEKIFFDQHLNSFSANAMIQNAVFKLVGLHRTYLYKEKFDLTSPLKQLSFLVSFFFFNQ